MLGVRALQLLLGYGFGWGVMLHRKETNLWVAHQCMGHGV